MSSYEGVAIVGYGETEYHKKKRMTPLWYVANAIRRSLDHAGLKPSEVDGLAVTSFELSPDHVTTVAEHLGFTLSWAFHGVYGGASGIIGMMEGARAIRDGQANVVVVVAADSFDVEEHMEMADRFNVPLREYVAPYGYGGPNGIFALVQRRHMHEYGTTREQLSNIAITQRYHASLNPNALLRDPLSREDYLNARIIADPIRLYDCVLPCGGGDAVVLTTVERARHLKDRHVRIPAGGQRHNHHPDQVVWLSAGWDAYADGMFAEAGMERGDIDMVQLYDDYPIMELIQLEDLGFCRKGDGGPFLARTDLSIHGQLPLNTGGGQLSCGQCGAGGGMIGPVEAVRQLFGEGGDHQVPDAQTALIAGFGLVAYGHGLSCSAAILEVGR